jgi:hypothetical protein
VPYGSAVLFAVNGAVDAAERRTHHSFIATFEATFGAANIKADLTDVATVF